MTIRIHRWWSRTKRQRKHNLHLSVGWTARWVSVICLLLVATATIGWAQNSGEDESLLATIRLAARGGDFELANTRLASLKKPRLIAMGTAALGIEHAHAGAVDQADELLDKSQVLADQGDMRTLERAQSYMYFARVMNSHENYTDASQDMLDRAIEYIGRLAGIDLNLAIAEMVSVTLELSDDRQQAYDLLQLLSDTTLRDKLLQVYNLEEYAN